MGLVGGAFVLHKMGITKNQIIAAISVFTLVLAGGTTYIVTITKDSITLEFDHTECGIVSFEVTKQDHNKFKCGRYIIAEWDTVTSHEKIGLIGSGYFQNDRKNSKTKLYIVNATPEFITIVKEVKYYKGSTGSDGVLKELYYFYPDGLKWNYELDTVNKAKHFVTLRMYKYNPKHNFLFYPDDPFGTFKFSKKPSNRYGDYYYGGVSGDLFIDPLIKKIPIDAVYVTGGVYFRQLNKTIIKTRTVLVDNGTYENGSTIYYYTQEKYNLNVSSGINEIGYNNVKFNDTEISFNCINLGESIKCDSKLSTISFIISSEGIEYTNLFNGYTKSNLEEVGLV